MDPMAPGDLGGKEMRAQEIKYPLHLVINGIHRKILNW